MCLVKLGFRRYSATRAGQNFLKYDEAAMRKLAPHRHDESAYIFTAREQIQLQEQLLTNDREANPTLNDHAWDSDRFVRPPPTIVRTITKNKLFAIIACDKEEKSGILGDYSSFKAALSEIKAVNRNMTSPAGFGRPCQIDADGR